MSTEQNRDMIRRNYEESFNKGNISFLNELMAPDYVGHMGGGIEVKGPEAFGRFLAMLRTAFPDMKFTVENIVAEGDYVAHRYAFMGTHKGDFMGIAPTGKRVTFTSNVLSRFEGAKKWRPGRRLTCSHSISS